MAEAFWRPGWRARATVEAFWLWEKQQHRTWLWRRLLRFRARLRARVRARLLRFRAWLWTGLQRFWTLLWR
ncbi:uncharacterized protein V6R79_020734 [Siganus canaliculatus]